ncbi:hydrogenase maturation nickel metallochaperone HypA [uncultured Cohaesibacter sp.]|uniref:hydrogenase maturation nickel metallochaperone HypA n=1 Tax=uncultured Cohaesibacter sp. TaxID=1002546 RepID=UPI00292F26AF|nr:hydrogenase maturation nickel metallochaperone HypA [uncultured Cohaesibacter sp.]
MHELSLCQSLIQLTERIANSCQATKVIGVTVEMGTAVAIEEETFRFCFDAVANDTIADGSKLTIEWIRLKLQCQLCGNRYYPTSSVIPEPCPQCGSFDTKCLSGREFTVKHIEVEEQAKEVELH